jgi:hypothetical protein
MRMTFGTARGRLQSPRGGWQLQSLALKTASIQFVAFRIFSNMYMSGENFWLLSPALYRDCSYQAAATARLSSVFFLANAKTHAIKLVILLPFNSCHIYFLCGTAGLLKISSRDISCVTIRRK